MERGMTWKAGVHDLPQRLRFEDTGHRGAQPGLVELADLPECSDALSQALVDDPGRAEGIVARVSGELGVRPSLRFRHLPGCPRQLDRDEEPVACQQLAAVTDP